MPMPITSLMTGIFALMMVILCAQVSVKRLVSGTRFGDGDDPVLRRRVRAHGNFTESAPITLAIVAMLEITPAPLSMVWAVATVLTASRVGHAISMLYFEALVPRALAMISQYLALSFAACWLILNFLKSS